MPMTTETERDKRKNERVPFPSPIRCYYNGSQKYFDTVGRDINNKGIGFITNDFIAPSTKIIFELKAPEYKKMLGEVVWAVSQPFSDRFNVGAKFITSLKSA